MDYFPQPIPHEKLNTILNSIGLEVEGYDSYEEIKGNLAGLVTGLVLTVEKHPNADRLAVTTVNIGEDLPLQIVCGAPNVAAGQKVIVATVGTTIYPTNGAPITMRAAKIRGVESMGMICAADEIGLGTDHDGIKVLDPETPIGILVSSCFDAYEDHIISIGLTPNRSDAMSHIGVARDICAWLNHHEGSTLLPIITLNQDLAPREKESPINVVVENTVDCPRYAGLCISGVTVGTSPSWLTQRLKAIGQRPINNIVDITNYILHDTGQPLHAFDADAIAGNSIIVKNLAAGTVFLGLDEKERKLDATDLMVCDGNGQPLCMGGVFGGAGSGVSASTNNIFLESAWFHPVSIRKSSFRHQLRTDAAMHFEKSVDIGQTVEVLRKAGLLITAIAGGTITADPIDVYPSPAVQPTITLEYAYVQKLSGKAYEKKTIKQILEGMGFQTVAETQTAITLKSPSHKTDVHIPADLVEEIMRIDGFDNIDIPTSIKISPAVTRSNRGENIQEKLSSILAGMGFNEMLNNSITHSAHYTPAQMTKAVKMLNNLSAELDTLRLTMLETGLQTVARNLNHKNENIRLFEFGKTYSTDGTAYQEDDHLALFTAGLVNEVSWNRKADEANFYYVKGVVQSLQLQSGIKLLEFTTTDDARFEYGVSGSVGNRKLVTIGKPSDQLLKHFDIRVPVWYADIDWANWVKAAEETAVHYTEISKYPEVHRDLSFLADLQLPYSAIEQLLNSLSIKALKSFRLFDVFNSEKLGKDKQSLAMNFSFADETKTLKDDEIDQWMKKISHELEQQLHAEIRK